MEQIQRKEVNQVFNDPNTVAQPVVTTNGTVVTQAPQPVQSVESSTVQYRKTTSERASQIIGLIVGLIEVLLVLRIIFLLLGGRNVGFANLIYNLSIPFVAPFQGIFPAPTAAGTYFDTAAILAMIIWGLVGLGISALINAMDKRAV